MGIRSFIAVECHNRRIHKKFDEVQGRLKSTQANMKIVDIENIHLTLKFLGDIEDHQLEEVSKVIREISFKPFKIRVESIGVFPNLRRPKTIWAGISLGIEELSDILKQINKGLEKIGFEKENRKFHPHLTLARVRSGLNKERLINEILEIEKTLFGELQVNHIYLKKSVLTSRGPIYSTMAESK